MPQTADITAIGLSCLIYAFMRIKHKIENKPKTSIGFQPDNSNLKKRKGINKINITVPDWVPGLGGKNFGFNIPTIPALYTGTENWKGGTAIINEKAYGGEIVDLPSGSRVYPHDESIDKAYNDGVNASFGGNSITIAKLADEIVVREDADIERIVNELARKLGDACASTGSAMAMSKMSNKVQSVNKAFAGV